MSTGRLPDFFVVGAAKGGTTSLYRYLDEHPDVFMSSVKDPNYFCLDAPWSEWFTDATTTLKDYSALFADAGAAKAVGESSVSYLPHSPAAGRIQELVPHARIVAILREPADRAYSDYVWLRAHGLREPRTFREVVAAELEGRPGAMHFVWSGFYAQHLDRYLQLFDRAQVRVFLFDDLAADASGVMRDLFGFLGVDPTFVPDLRVYNTAQYPARSEAVARVLREDSSLKAAARTILPARARTRIKTRITASNRDVPAFEPDVRAQLREVYRADILRLQDLIDRDLSVWLAP